MPRPVPYRCGDASESGAVETPALKRFVDTEGFRPGRVARQRAAVTIEEAKPTRIILLRD
jgi:hypothetical protein